MSCAEFQITASAITTTQAALVLSVFGQQAMIESQGMQHTAERPSAMSGTSGQDSLTVPAKPTTAQSASPDSSLPTQESRPQMDLQGATSKAAEVSAIVFPEPDLQNVQLYTACLAPVFRYETGCASSKQEWYLIAGFKAVVNNDMQFFPVSMRAIYAHSAFIWKLTFPTQQAYSTFESEYTSKLAENTKLFSDGEKVRSLPPMHICEWLPTISFSQGPSACAARSVHVVSCSDHCFAAGLWRRHAPQDGQ